MAMIASAIGTIAIVSVLVVSIIAFNRANYIKDDYNSKIKNVVDQINSAQYYEYNFDKKQSQKTKELGGRIEKIEKKLNNGDLSLNSLQANSHINVGKSSWMQKDGTAMLGGALSVGGAYDPHEVNKWGWKASVHNGSKGPHAVIAHRDGLGMHINTGNREPNKWALELHNGSESMFRVHNDGKAYTSGSIQHTKSDPGSMLEKNYGNDANRYGIGQWPQGATRVYAATAYPGTVSLSLAGANNTFDDALTVSKEKVDVRKSLVLSDSSSLCISPNNCIDKNYISKLKTLANNGNMCIDGVCLTKDDINYLKSIPQQLAVLKTCSAIQPAGQQASAVLREYPPTQIGPGYNWTKNLNDKIQGVDGTVYCTYSFNVTGAPYGNGLYTTYATSIWDYSSSQNYGGDEWPPSGIFDKRPGSSGQKSGWHTSPRTTMSASTDSQKPPVVVIKLPYPIAVRKYSVRARADCCMDQPPSKWELQASSDGINWKTIDSQSNVSSWKLSEEKAYSVSNTTTYLYYRFVALRSSGSTAIHLGELRLYAYE